ALTGVETLIKSGAGTLVFSATSGYSGATTVSAGTLEMNGSLASSAVTVQNGATIDGTGTTGDLTVEGGGTVAPGITAGTLNIGNLSLASGAIFAEQIGGTTAGSNYDQLNVTGTVSLGGATLNLSLINSFAS